MATTTKTQGIFRSHLAGSDRPRATRDEVLKRDRVGVVFVHGIGSQKPAETLLQWSGPIIEVLTDWWCWPADDRSQRSFPNLSDQDPSDPVIEAAIDLTSPLPTITLRIPATTFPDRSFPKSEWVMTEAWWASKVSPPGLSTMTSWLGPGGAAGRIVEAILANRAGESRWINVARAFLVPFVTVLAATMLTVYAMIRGIIGLIPVQAVKDAAILRAFDEFLIGWFGDTRILLYDPAQSANIRAGLADAILRLRETCDRVVVVAHSGGVMVSYLTLTDPALAVDVQVDKLITFGEGWNLALRLTDDNGGMSDRIRQNIFSVQSKLRWQDYYASHDPAPAGPVDRAEAPPSLGAEPRLRSHEVWNRRSILGDHGGYFDNDEEFTIQTIREIDVPAGWAEDSRFYRPDSFLPVASAPTTSPPDTALEPRASRHRQRVALAALWRHMVVVFGVTTVALALALAPGRLILVGAGIQRWIPSDVPVLPDLADGIRWLSVDWLDNVAVDLPLLPATGPGDVAHAAERLGLGVLQAVLLISAAYLVFSGPRAFRAWREWSAIWWGLLATELAGVIAAVGGVAQLLVITRHDRLLGTGPEAWIPGIVVFFGTMALALAGTWVAKRFPVPLIANVYAAVAVAFFIAALTCSVVAIARVDKVFQAEFAYVAIWVGAFAIMNVGLTRWAAWDRIERKVARGSVADRYVNRKPVIATSAGVLATAFSLMGLVIYGPTGPVEAVGALGILMIGIGMAWGSRAWREYGNPVRSLGPVESGGA